MLDKLPISAGMGPIRWLFPKSKILSFFNFPISFGIFPIRMFPRRILMKHSTHRKKKKTSEKIQNSLSIIKLAYFQVIFGVNRNQNRTVLASRLYDQVLAQETLSSMYPIYFCIINPPHETYIYQMSSDKKKNFTDKGGRQKGIKASYILIMWSLDGEHLMPFQSQGSESETFQLDMTSKGSLYIASFSLLRASTGTRTTRH